jgi:hypothetical protein
LELGKLVGDEEPEFEGTINRALQVHGDARNAACNGFVHEILILGRGRGFKREQSGAQGRRQTVGQSHG